MVGLVARAAVVENMIPDDAFLRCFEDEKKKKDVEPDLTDHPLGSVWREEKRQENWYRMD